MATILPPGVVRTPMGHYVLRDDTHLSRWVEQQHRLDLYASEIATFARFIPESGTVIEAGACLGDHTLTYSQVVGSEGHVFVFEPHPLTRQALLLNVARVNNVTVFPHGVSDEAGTAAVVHVPNVGASYLTDHAGGPISLVTLDAFLLPMLERCDFFHLDAEGWECRILNGARHLLARFRPAMKVEVCDMQLRRAGASEAALFALLNELGYKVTKVGADPTLYDVLAVPR